jgi:urease subunit gamma/beta
VQLTPTEEERLRIFTAAQLARATLAKGLQLNAPEAVALVCDEMHAAGRGGASFDEVAAAGRAAVRPDQVIDGVAGIVPEIRVEVLLEEGTRLLVLRQPFGSSGDDDPGAIRFGEGDVELALGRDRIHLRVTNRGEHPIRVSSHFPFWRSNDHLEFDRTAAEGFRLDLPSGDSLRWAPGETHEVDLVRYGGTGAPARA